MWFLLASGNNQLPWKAKKRPSFYFCSLVYIFNTFLRILADPKSAHLSISSMDVSTPMVLRYSFILSGIVPNATHHYGYHLCPYASHLSDFSRESLIFFYFIVLFCSHDTLLSSGIATSIIWLLFSLLSMINRSDLLPSISWSVRILKSHSIL